MFFKIFALFALIAVAFAAPKPQFLTYSGGVDYTYPVAGVSPYAYSAYSAYPAYSGYPYTAGSYYVR